MSESHSHSHDHGQEHAHDVSKHVKTYVVIFVLLLVGTAVTVLLNAVHFDSVAVTVGVALFVAVIKAFLVAGYFMHLISEKRMIYAILVSTVFFFAGMMYLTIWARGELPQGSRYFGAPNPLPASSSTPF